VEYLAVIVLEFLSYRDEGWTCAGGSLFIQELCSVLNGSSEEDDLLSLMTKVGRKVSEKYVEERKVTGESIAILKQITCTVNLLTKKVHLKKGIKK